MKKILSIIAILALFITVSSCGNKKKTTGEHVGTHTHEDGTVYSNDAHSHANDATPAQESFEVKADSDAEHKHEGGDADVVGSDNKHGDETSHDHDSEHGEHK